MSRREPEDLLQRVLADADLDELRLLADLSDPKQALVTGLAVTKANKIADELSEELSPRAWAGVQVERTSLGAVLRNLRRPAQAATEGHQAPDGRQDDSRGLHSPNSSRNAPEAPK